MEQAVKYIAQREKQQNLHLVDPFRNYSRSPNKSNINKKNSTSKNNTNINTNKGGNIKID